jgi:hypothetical protein
MPLDPVATSPWWPAVDRAVLGLYEGQGRIHVAIRASLAAPHSKPELSAAAVERLLQLPQTTLFASATTVDLEAAYEATTKSPLPGTLGRYLALLRGIWSPPLEVPDGRPPQLGPHVIAAWGQDLTEGGTSPQLVVMVECTDGRAVRDKARETAERMIRLIRVIEPAEVANALTITQSRHLGVTIQRVSLTDYVKKSRLPLVKLLAGAEPAWAVWNGWLYFALSHQHIERIIDAQFGLLPTLATVPDVRALRPPRAGPAGWAVLSIIQPGLATDVLDQWLKAYEAESPSLLDPIWWPGQTSVGGPEQRRLGIGVRVGQEPGAVVVARVYPNTAAEGRLQPEDRIIGIDGHLLSLTSSNTDLRKRWAESTARPGPTLRVWRGGTAIEMVLPKKAREESEAEARIRPADAVRELASLGRTLEFVSFAVNVSDERHYSARLSLRLGPGQVSNASSAR